MCKLTGVCAICGKAVPLEILDLLADVEIRAMALQVLNGGKAIMPELSSSVQNKDLKSTSLLCPVCKAHMFSGTTPQQSGVSVCSE